MTTAASTPTPPGSRRLDPPPAAAPSTDSPAATFQRLPLTELREFKYNRRSDFGNLEGLAASIKAQGVIEPIVVRMANVKRAGTGVVSHDGYEIIAGHRRFRASKLAGLPDIPAIVREATDAEACILNVLENKDREDLHPLDEAAEFQVLIEVAKLDAHQIAEKIGKSYDFVVQRMNLRRLALAAEAAFREGKLPTEHALILSRLNEGDQKRALARCLADQPTVKAFREYVDEEIKKANARQAISDALARLKQEGYKGTVQISRLQGWDAKAYGLPKNTLYVDDYKLAGNRECTQQVKAVYVDWDKAGAVETVCLAGKGCEVHYPKPKPAAKEKAKPKKPSPTPAAPTTEPDAPRGEDEEPKAAAQASEHLQLQSDARELAERRAVIAVAKVFHRKPALTVADIADLAGPIADNSSIDLLEALCEHFAVKKGTSPSVKARCNSAITKARSVANALEWLMGLRAAEILNNNGPRERDAFFRRHHVDFAKLHKEALAELKAKAEAAAKPPAKLKPAPQVESRLTKFKPSKKKAKAKK